MRSSGEYIITKSEVHAYAEDWLGTALRLEYRGYKCTSGTLLQILLIAAARVVSLFAACRDLADAPSDQTIRNALAATLPEIGELERRLNLALVRHVPKALRRKSRMVAIDLTLIPYHGQPARDPRRDFSWRTEVGHDPFPCLRHGGGCPQGLSLHLGPDPGGIRRFHERGGAATVADCRPQGGQSQFSPAGQGVFQRGGDPLSAPRRSWIHHSRRCARAQTEGPEDATARSAGTAEEEQRVLPGDATKGTTGGKQKTSTIVTICVASKDYTQKKTGKRRRKRLLYVVWKVRSHAQGDPRDLSQAFRHRDQLPTNERGEDQDLHARSRPAIAVRGHRLGVAQRLGVDCTFRLAKGKFSEEPQLFLELLRFQRNVALDHASRPTRPRR